MTKAPLVALAFVLVALTGCPAANADGDLPKRVVEPTGGISTTSPDSSQGATPLPPNTDPNWYWEAPPWEGEPPPSPVTNPAWQWEELPWEGKAPHQLWVAPSGDGIIVAVADWEKGEVVVFSGSPQNWKSGTLPVPGNEGRPWSRAPWSVTVDGARGVVDVILPPTVQWVGAAHVAWGADGWSDLEAAPIDWVRILDTEIDPATGQVYALVHTGTPGNPALGGVDQVVRYSSLASLGAEGWDSENLQLDGWPVVVRSGAISFSPGGDLLLTGTLGGGVLLAGEKAKEGALELEVVPLREKCSGFVVTPPVVAQPGGEVYFGLEAYCEVDERDPNAWTVKGMGRIIVAEATNIKTLFLLSRAPGEQWVAERLLGLVDEGPEQLVLDDSGRVHFLHTWWNHTEARDRGPQVYHSWQDGAGGWSQAPLGASAFYGYSPSFQLTRDDSGTWHAWFLTQRSYDDDLDGIVHAWLPAGTSDTEQSPSP